MKPPKGSPNITYRDTSWFIPRTYKIWYEPMMMRIQYDYNFEDDAFNHDITVHQNGLLYYKGFAHGCKFAQDILFPRAVQEHFSNWIAEKVILSD